MAEMQIPVENHGVYGNPVTINVDGGDEDRLVRVEFQPEGDDPTVYRALLPAEARALAAALTHFASEAERG